MSAEISTEEVLEHLATISWQRGKWSGTRGKYAREHEWHFAEDVVIRASEIHGPNWASRARRRLDPLQTFVASIASAHMLSWLHVAFSHGAEVESYLDKAQAILSSESEERWWVREIMLTPRVTFSAHQSVTPAALARFHELAQQDCFIAQSIKTKVSVRSA